MDSTSTPPQVQGLRAIFWGATAGMPAVESPDKGEK